MDGFNCMNCGYWPCDDEGRCHVKPAAWYCGCDDDEETEIWMDAFKKNTMAMLSSYYEGDIVYDSNHSCSAVATLPNGKIVLALPHNSQIGGKLVLVDTSVTPNHFTWYDVNIGHCNSMTWDNKNKKLIITPMFRTGTKNNWYDIIEITFNNINDVDPTITVENVDTGIYSWVFMGVAYNYADQKVYLARWGGREIYTWENHKAIKFMNLLGSFADNTDVAYNQGFAVKGDELYLSHARGYIGVYSRLTGEHIREWMLSKEDHCGFYFFGELEDFDFDKNGNLFAARYVTLPGNKVDYFYTYIATDRVMVPHPHAANSAANWTFYLWDNHTDSKGKTWYDNDTFKNDWTHVKHPSQLCIIGAKFNMVNKLEIDSAKDLGVVSINLPLLIFITKMKCQQLEISSDVSLYSAVAGANIEFTHAATQTWSIFLNRIAFLRLINHDKHNLTFTTPNGILGVRIDDFLPMLANRANLIINGTSTYDTPTLFEIGGNTYTNVMGFFIGMNQVDVWTP